MSWLLCLCNLLDIAKSDAECGFISSVLFIFIKCQPLPNVTVIPCAIGFHIFGRTESDEEFGSPLFHCFRIKGQSSYDVLLF